MKSKQRTVCLAFIMSVLIMINAVVGSMIELKVEYDLNRLKLTFGNTTSEFDVNNSFTTSLTTDVECNEVTNVVQSLNRTDLDESLTTILNDEIDQNFADQQVWFTDTLMPQKFLIDQCENEKGAWSVKYQTCDSLLNYVNGTMVSERDNYHQDKNIMMWLVISLSVCIVVMILLQLGTGKGWFRDLKEKVRM